MSRRFGRLPSMQALVGFESAARLKSFSRAAEELNKTQSAVSHQIRSLEELLGQDVFRRLGRTVELTDAGADLLETTVRTLNTLGSGINRLDFYTKPGSVVFNCPPAWARHWLLHRLPALKTQCPELDPWIHTTEDATDFDHSEADCAVWYGEGSWSGLSVEILCKDTVSPVCTAAYAAKFDSFKDSARLLEADLLHDERWDGWNTWFNETGLDRPAPVSGVNFSDPGLMLDAALSGQGVALASLALAEHYLATGTLVKPFTTNLKSNQTWYLVGEPKRISRPAAKSFWDWVVRESLELKY